MTEPRKYTRLVLEAVEGGLMDPQQTLEMCLRWMSEYDVEEMVKNDPDLHEMLAPEDFDEELEEEFE